MAQVSVFTSPSSAALVSALAHHNLAAPVFINLNTVALVLEALASVVVSALASHNLAALVFINLSLAALVFINLSLAALVFINLSLAALVASVFKHHNLAVLVSSNHNLVPPDLAAHLEVLKVQSAFKASNLPVLVV